MPHDVLLALLTFAAVTCFTPGPNNAMLMASGLNFGLRRSAPHVLGVALGFSFMVLAVGLGIGQLLVSSPIVYTGLRIVAVAYLLWLAWGIANSRGIEEGAAGARPLSFLEACAFQWVNPKGWVMAIGATTSYVIVGGLVSNAALTAAIFAVIGFASSAAWAVFGASFRRLFDDARTLRLANITLALLLVASLYPVLVEVAATMRGR